MAAAIAAIWFDEGIFRNLPKYWPVEKSNLDGNQQKETSSMNFNDIELRLRYHHYFGERGYFPHSPQHKAASVPSRRRVDLQGLSKWRDVIRSRLHRDAKRPENL